MTLEKTIEQRACHRVTNELGVPSKKFVVPGDNGWPDRIFLIPGGRPFFIEFKVPGGTPTPKQLFIHDWLRRLGYDIEVHDNADRAFEAVRDRLDAARLPKKGR
jgi:hypothetical protein